MLTRVPSGITDIRREAINPKKIAVKKPKRAPKSPPKEAPIIAKSIAVKNPRNKKKRKDFTSGIQRHWRIITSSEKE